MPIDPSSTLAELVLARPAHARVFELHGLDYCCNGGRTLTAACEAQGLDPAAVAAALAAEPSEGVSDEQDWTLAPLADLCIHIVEHHHGRLRTELPRLTGIAEKVVRAHGSERPELLEVQGVLAALRSEFEEHMEDEETHLFPALVAGGTPGPEALAQLEHDHDDTGAALRRLRELTAGYDRRRAACSTYLALLEGLHELELDVHQHVHEENNVLFPRARALAA